MAITSKLSRHKIMERAIKALMANNLPPRFKFKDTYASIEVPTAYTQHLPTQQEIEDKFAEIEAEEETIVDRELTATIISKDDSVITSNLEVGTANLFVDTLTGNVGIGTTNPVGILHIHSTDSIILPSGTTVQRSQTPVNGMLRYNTTDSKLEVYVSSVWKYIEYLPTYLYEFTSHTFTNAGAIGQNGPTLTMCRDAYNVAWVNKTIYFNVVTLGIQEWTVPDTGTYEIDAYGATGGYAYLLNTTSTISYGGRGARLRGIFSLTKGDVVKILVGQMGVNNPNNGRGAGGGGGTFVYNNTTSTLLIAAGGGGGGGQYSRLSSADANHNSTSGNSGSTNISNYGAGGTNGNGGGTVYPGAGAGWLSDGADGSHTANAGGGHTFNNGGLGGAQYSNGQVGGFGGGGGCYIGGGGGGGYSGGGGGGWSMSGHGGGGGSYMSSSATSTLRETNAVENTNGKVTITLI